MGREQRRYATGGTVSSGTSSGVRETRGNTRVTFELRPSARHRDLDGAALQRAKVRLYNERRSPANARHIVAEREAPQSGRVPYQGVARDAERTVGQGQTAFGGCNVELDSVENRR